MSKRSNTWQKATALVPVALLSGAWTASLAATSATAAGDAPGRLPDGTSMPAGAIEAPASVSGPGEIAPGVPAGSAGQVVSSASTNGIPAAALAAYQRAAQVIASADSACNLDWPLVAAIGRVESDHGRYGGNVLTADGVSDPGIYGIPLDGTNGTQRITDTDAGAYDQDAVYDRAVGPMQFIPSTWSVVGVDGDGDGRRNPQDIDDAALAAAVYLCSGDEDLSTEAGVDAAVFRYNHSQAYVDLVKSIAAAYAAGDYLATPTSSYASPYFGQSYDDSVFSTGTTGHHVKPHKGSTGGQGDKSDQPDSSGSGEHASPDPTPPPTGGQPDDGGNGDPGDAVDDKVTDVPKTVKNGTTALERATAYCKENLSRAEIDQLGGLQACTKAYLDGGAGAVQDLLDSLSGVVGGLLP